MTGAPSSTVVLAGGCLCGAIRYEVDPSGGLADYCHCRSCRKASGGMTVAWLQVPPEQFRLTSGEPTGYGSSALGTRWHCAVCGSHTHATTNRRGSSVGVTIATLDDPEAVRPLAHGFDSDRVSWFVLADDAVRYSHAPPYDDD